MSHSHLIKVFWLGSLKVWNLLYLKKSILNQLKAVAAELREAAEEIRTKGESGNLGKNGIGFYTDSGKFKKNPDAWCLFLKIKFLNS